jgi:hypothetical protein
VARLRVAGGRVQYRPADVLDTAERAWLARHGAEVARALETSAEPEHDAHRPLGEAGPGVPAWRCPIDLGSGHVPRRRPDGSTVCATCHPATLAARPAGPVQ